MAYRKRTLVRLIKPAAPRLGHEYESTDIGKTGTVLHPWPRDEPTEYYAVRLTNGRLRIRHWDELEVVPAAP